MKITGAWYLDQFPTKFIVELPNGELKFANIVVHQQLTEDDLTPFGYHPDPACMRGVTVMPAYMYPYYGLENVSTT